MYGYLNETPVAWGRNGTLYWGMTGSDPAAAPELDLSVVVARSSNLGDSWEWGMAFDGRDGADDRTRPSRPVTALAVDTKTGAEDIVYVGWETWPADPRTLALVAVSTDGGRTFAEPRNPLPAEVSQRLGGAEGLETLPPQLVVDGDGTLFVLFPGNPTDDEKPNCFCWQDRRTRANPSWSPRSPPPVTPTRRPASPGPPTAAPTAPSTSSTRTPPAATWHPRHPLPELHRRWRHLQRTAAAERRRPRPALRPPQPADQRRA